jgi:rhodanese-related sulfurtransferase
MESELTPAQVLAMHERGEIQLVDVRTPDEHEAGRIAGDVHVELGELSARAGEIDRDRPVVFYCRTGARSGMATDAFRQAGYDAANLVGGLKAWTADGFALVPEDGVVAD